MDRETRNAFKLYVLLGLLETLVFCIEFTQVDPNQRWAYAIMKSYILGSCVTASILLYRSKKWSTLAHGIMFAAICLYTGLGEIFRPAYGNSLVTVLVVAVLFVPLKRKIMYFGMFIATTFFSYVYYINYERNIKLALEMNVYDNIFTYVAMGLVTGLVAHALKRERDLREKAQSRYSLIGTHAAAIIHDLKNILSSPRLQVENLQNLLKIEPNPEVSEVLKDIELTLTHASESAIRLNQMTLLANNQKSLTNLSNVVSEVRAILRQRLRGIEVVVEGERTLLADQGFIISLFLNLFLNSISAMTTTTEKRISILIDAKKIQFCDTGAGFPTAVLTSIGKNISVTTKSDGSGNGLLIVKEACFDLGATVKFYNIEGGACVEIYV
ncbi:MAG: HAMP domain-containing histidine kinase [Bdellovibrio sp.]|nr:HAMP domain-containing histidine kinase [Bdellovibrio sp.]